MITPVQIFNLQKNIYTVLKQPKINFAENIQEDVSIKEKKLEYKRL